MKIVFTVYIHKKATKNMVPCALLFSHRVHYTLMAAPQCAVLKKRRNPWIVALFAVKMRRVRRIAARLAKITNHKSVARVLIKKRCTDFTNCCILFDVYHMYVYEKV